MPKCKDYSYIVPGYRFPVSNMKCLSHEYSRRDAPTAKNPLGRLRHYVMVECPFCLKEFEDRIDRCEFNPETQDGPRSWCCKQCSLTHKRPWKDPWRNSKNNCAEKNYINTNHAKNLEGKIFGGIVVGPADEGYTDKFGLAWWPCKCKCGNFEFIRSNVLQGTNRKNGIEKFACSKCTHTMSTNEQATENWLKQHKINYSKQTTFDDLYGTGGGKLSYDFTIKNTSGIIIYAIENQGKQHYEPIKFFGGEEQFKKQQIHDNLKRAYCKEHNIKLIEIPYNYENLDDYLNQILVN